MLPQRLRRPTCTAVTALAIGSTFLLPPPAAMAAGPGDDFVGPVDYATGNGPVDVVLADVNGDGDLDSVTANYGAGGVSVLLGNGDGTFAAATGFSASMDYVGGVAVGDIAGDSNLDILVSGAIYDDATYDYYNAVLVLVGDGTGAFTDGTTSKINFTADSDHVALALGDFNGDTELDAVATTAQNSRSQAAILLNDGTGDFSTGQQILTTGSRPDGVAVGDFNGDTKPDVVTANYSSSSASVFLNNGSGVFAAKTDYATDSSPTGVKVADMNGDGRADLVVGTTSSKVDILLGVGNGTFGAKSAYTTTTSTGGIDVGDVNGDTLLDVVVGSINNFYRTRVLLGNGDGSLGTPKEYTLTNWAASLALGDLNGDDKLDITVTQKDANKVSVLLNTTPLALSFTNDTLHITPPPRSTFGLPTKYVIHYNTQSRIDASGRWGMWARNWPVAVTDINFSAAKTVAGCETLSGDVASCYRPAAIGEQDYGETLVYRVWAYNGTEWSPASSSLTVTRPTPD